MFTTTGKPISSYVQTSDQYYHCISYIYLIYDLMVGQTIVALSTSFTEQVQN